MKIAVYTIALNEETFVQRWIESARDADFILIADTGSTDRTVEIAENLGASVVPISITPWRFDDARNAALEALPTDIDLCIALDMDEVLQPGWRAALETVPDGTTRPRYKYVWSWNDDGSEGLVYGADKIHTRHSYRWKHPVHEVLQPTEITEQQHWVDGLEIHHYPDKSKSRAQYLPLLEMAVAEDPDDARNQFYLGREYFYQHNTQLAIKHLTLATMLQRWAPERAAAYRMLYALSGQVINLYRALAEDPCRRENLVALAQHYYATQSWGPSWQFAKAALDVTEKPLDYLCEADAWGSKPWDLAAIASWHLGNARTAEWYGKKALEIDPDNERLQRNLEWYTRS